MIGQKRIKTQGYQIHDISQTKNRKQKPDKSSVAFRPHKQSDIHLKSISKDITPKKHSIVVQKSKYKESSSGNKMCKSKQLTSVCSYSAIQKESIPATKRKGSNARSVKKKFSKNGGNGGKLIHQSLKSTVGNFSILTKCLTEYIKQQRKKGNDPGLQILHLIKAFNKSQVAPLSKQLELLISNMLDYIQDTVGIKDGLEPGQEKLPHGLKSRSSFSSASEREVVYSQILESSAIPSTVKKNNKENNSMEMKYGDGKLRTSQLQYSDGEKQQKAQYKEPQPQPNSKPTLNKQLQISLKRDLKNMHEQLHQLKSAGQKLQFKQSTQNEEKKKFEELYHRNKKIIQSMHNVEHRGREDQDSEEEDQNY